MIANGILLRYAFWRVDPKKTMPRRCHRDYFLKASHSDAYQSRTSQGTSISFCKKSLMVDRNRCLSSLSKRKRTLSLSYPKRRMCNRQPAKRKRKTNKTRNLMHNLFLNLFSIICYFIYNWFPVTDTPFSFSKVPIRF